MQYAPGDEETGYATQPCSRKHARTRPGVHVNPTNPAPKQLKLNTASTATHTLAHPRIIRSGTNDKSNSVALLRSHRQSSINGLRLAPSRKESIL